VFQSFLMVMQGIAALVVVCLVAYLFIRFGLRPAFRGGGRGSGEVKLLDRMPLDSRGGSALLLVEVGEKVLLLGVTSGSINLIKEIDPRELDLDEEEIAQESPWERMPFAELLKKMTGKKD